MVLATENAYLYSFVQRYKREILLALENNFLHCIVPQVSLNP